MDEFSAHVKTVQKVTFFFLSLCFLGWALFPDLRPYVSGLILGTVTSLVSSQYLSWKIRQLTAAALSGEKRKMNIGFVTRASLALLAVIAAYRFEQVAISTTIVGLGFTQMAAFWIGVFTLVKKRKSC